MQSYNPFRGFTSDVRYSPLSQMKMGIIANTGKLGLLCFACVGEAVKHKP